MQLDDGSDQQLIADYLDGDEKSFKILVGKYFRPIYNFTYHICNKTEEAEDITQEVFVKIWKNLKKYKPEQNFRIWLFSIAKNTTIDWLRKRKNVAISEFDTEDGGNFIEDTTADDTQSPDEIAVLSENKKVLSEKIALLSPIHQTVLIMHYTEEFSFKEMSEILQKPINTIKSQHHRALIELKKHFNS